ncbi:MAG: hypothetical protein HWD63_13255 [Candidatus Parvibacillus calidus]|nr:MAG: hypothetical protein HWD63_13255 [Candidatus Parvibacillus calidus]
MAGSFDEAPFGSCVDVLVLYQYRIKKPICTKVFAALIWSWMGDVLLMMVPINANFFLFGLGAFLIAQLAYASAFYEDARLRVTDRSG